MRDRRLQKNRLQQRTANSRKRENNMDNKKIERINALARKSKTEGLTEEEKREQASLRKEYIASVRMNLRAQLDNINIQETDGSITNLGEKYGNKTSH